MLYKSFALYTDKKTHDVIKSKIGSFDQEDMVLTYTVEGEKSDAPFPKKINGYIAKSVTCQNGVTASWDSESWGLVNINANNQAKIKCNVDFDDIWEFDYIGDVQEFIAPKAGTYKIELWGAQGGDIIHPSGGENLEIYGGKGAYTSGNAQIAANEKIYVHVGQGSTYCGTNWQYNYNGGGSGGCKISNQWYGGNGSNITAGYAGGSGGGGGFFGGGTGYTNSGAGGGSGYIASSNLISSNEITKHMTCYNCTTSTATNTYTNSNTCHSATATADCAKEGDGYAKITYCGEGNADCNFYTINATLYQAVGDYLTYYGIRVRNNTLGISVDSASNPNGTDGSTWYRRTVNRTLQARAGDSITVSCGYGSCNLNFNGRSYTGSATFTMPSSDLTLTTDTNSSYTSRTVTTSPSV